MAKIDAQIAYIQKQNDLKAALLKSSSSEGMPQILSIMVDDKGATAQVIYNSGIVRWIKKGDVLLDGMNVLAVGKSSVLVGGRGSKFSLGFASPQQTSANGQPGTQQQQGALPPLPRVNIPMPLPPAATPPVTAAAPVAGGK